MSSMLSDTCITSRAVSPRPIIQQHHLQHHQAQHHHQQQHHSYHHAFDDGGVVSTPSSLHFLGGPQSLAGSQHCAFNAALRLPLDVAILPSSSSSSSSTYPVRGIPRAAFDPQVVCSEQQQPREEQLHPLVSNVSQPPPSQTAPQQDSSMRYSHLDLPILNAETYADGYQFKELGSTSRQQTNSSSPPTDDGPTVTVKKRLRKNEKAAVQQQDEGEEEAKGRRKRARGRPRLEPPEDQTLEDRRRTQVRVAQRKYRYKKEVAITDLESQVRDLKEVNDEMKDVFQRLLESAHHQGISQAPGFGEHLRKVQALVKRSREVGEEQQQQQDDNDESIPDVEEMVSEGGGRRRLSSQQTRTMTASSSMQGRGNGIGAIVETRRNHQHQPEQLYGGLIVTHEPVVQQSHAAVDPTTYHHSLSMSMHDQHHNNSAYQIIAAPTLENASFATNANTATSSAPFLFTNNIPTSSSASTAGAGQWTFAPWTTLPLPSSVAYQESAFARRLHRYATERAAYLVCLSDPPQDKMTRVFGFARLFETIEQIRDRTLAVLSRTRVEPLDNWNYPFYNLGGAGTHFPGMNLGRKDGAGNGLGNGDVGNGNGSGKSDDDGQTRGFRFGPMDEATSQIRDSLLTISQNIRMPGLQGLFWDCDEVEWYMRQNGVVVPDLSTDYCPVEVPAPGCSFFQYQEVARHREADPGENPNPNPVVTAAGPVPSSSVFAATSSAAAAVGLDLDVEEVGAWPQHVVNVNNTTVAGPSSGLLGAVGHPSGSGGMTMGSSPDHGLGLPPQQLHDSYASHVAGGGHIPGASAFVGGGTKVVELNVTKFLNGLTSRAACLGRTPGFRPKDVDAAFWESLVHDGA